MFKGFASSLLVFITLVFATSCVNQQFFKFRRTDNQTKRFIKRHQKNLVPEIYYSRVNGKNLRIISIGDTALPTTLMVHGSPSSATEFEMFLKDSLLVSKTRLLIVEKPGYGFSDFGKVDTNILGIAETIIKVSQPFIGYKKYNVLGNSYGGPVAAAIAAMDSDRVEKLILTASSLAPNEEKIYGISHHLHKKWLSWAIPKVFKMANVEKLSHHNALLELQPYLKSIKAKVWMIHGSDDHLIYLSNTDYAKKWMTNAAAFDLTVIKGGHHPLYWFKTEEVKAVFKRIF